MSLASPLALPAPTVQHPPVVVDEGDIVAGENVDVVTVPPRPASVWPLLALVAVGLSLLFALPLLATVRPTTVDYCAECAVRRETRSWNLRGTGFTLRSQDQEIPTLVSAALTRKGMVGPHAHRWLAPRFAPNPLNPYAPPVTLSLGFIDTPLVASFLTNLGDWSDPEMFRDTRQLVLRPEYSYLVNHSLRFLRFPPRGFPDRRHFQEWWTQNGFGLYSHLREETEPD